MRSVGDMLKRPKEGSCCGWRLIGAYGMAAVLVCLLISPNAQATSITYGMYEEFSGATAPESPTTPWMTATFDDGGIPGSVDLTLVTTNLIDNEHVKEWLFNFDPNPAFDLNLLDFTELDRTGTFTTPTITAIPNEYMANGDGFFDIKIAFDFTNGAENRFGPGTVTEMVKYVIESSDPITANSFDFLSWEDGGQGEYPTASHIGGIGPDDILSGWVTVPEPATLTLLAFGSLLFLRRRRR